MDTLESMKDNVDKLKLEEEKTKSEFSHKLYNTCSTNKMNGKWAS
ncbi:hypothetical protein QEE_1776 [Clostridioides difficile CD113]|nr:hypothetical protein QEE_1776 [Clostridioides difficile CD113]